MVLIYLQTMRQSVLCWESRLRRSLMEILQASVLVSWQRRRYGTTHHLLLMTFTNTNYVMMPGWGRASACQCGSEVKNIICSFSFPFTIKSRSVASHQKSYMLLAILAFLAFAATFAQILLLDRWLYEYLQERRLSMSFSAGLLQLVCSLFGLFWSFLASTVSSWQPYSTGSSFTYKTIQIKIMINCLACNYWVPVNVRYYRRERHALMGGKSTLSLLHSRAGYGSI